MHTAKITSLVCYLSLLVLLAGCKADRFKAVHLVSPAAGSKVEPRDLTFTWTTKDADPVRFVLGTPGFAQILLDTTLTGSTLTYHHALVSDASYIWQVEQGEHINSSSFRVVDVSARFLRHYSGKAHTYSYLMGSGSSTSNYLAEIDIARDGNKLHVTGDTEFTVPFYAHTDSTLQYAIPYLHTERYLTLDFVHDSIHIMTTDGGLGGQRTYWFDAGY
jgi:hypothetical protein